MKQFLLQRDPAGPVTVSGPDYHHLRHVRRVKRGESLPCLSPSGEALLMRVATDTGEAFVLEKISQAARVPSPSQKTISLFIALPRPPVMNAVIRQAAEAEVNEIQPFFASRSQNLGAVNEKERLQRWNRLVKAARQQSGSSVNTVVHAPVSGEELLGLWKGRLRSSPGAVGLLLAEPELKAAARKPFHVCLDAQTPAAALLVGPEGGFEEGEARRFLAAGFRPVSLGHSTLRVDTAAISAIAVTRALLEECDSWQRK